MNKHVKNAAFEEIGAAIGVSADDARDKLRNLRTNFMQIYKKIPKSGSGAVQQPKWEFYNAMLFMTGELTTAGDTDSVSENHILYCMCLLKRNVMPSVYNVCVHSANCVLPSQFPRSEVK